MCKPAPPPFIHARKSGKFFHGCRLDIINSLKVAHQFFPSCRPDARDVVENRVDLALAPQQAVVFDCKAVCLVLHACDQFEALAVPVDQEFPRFGNTDPSCGACRPFTIPQTGIARSISSSTSSAMLTWPRPPSIMIRSGNRSKPLSSWMPRRKRRLKTSFILA